MTSLPCKPPAPAMVPQPALAVPSLGARRNHPNSARGTTPAMESRHETLINAMHAESRHDTRVSAPLVSRPETMLNEHTPCGELLPTPSCAQAWVQPSPQYVPSARFAATHGDSVPVASSQQGWETQQQRRSSPRHVRAE